MDSIAPSVEQTYNAWHYEIGGNGNVKMGALLSNTVMGVFNHHSDSLIAVTSKLSWMLSGIDGDVGNIREVLEKFMEWLSKEATKLRGGEEAISSPDQLQLLLASSLGRQLNLAADKEYTGKLLGFRYTDNSTDAVIETAEAGPPSIIPIDHKLWDQSKIRLMVPTTESRYYPYRFKGDFANLSSKPGVLVSVTFRDTDRKLWAPADHIAALPCQINFDLNQFWGGEEYECTDRNFWKIFEYLSDEKIFLRPYSKTSAWEELAVDCFIYSYGMKQKWMEIVAAIQNRIHTYKGPIVERSVIGNALLQAKNNEDKPMYSLLMKILGHPSNILPVSQTCSTTNRTEKATV